MAQSYTTDSGITLKIPGTYVEQQVRANQGGIAAAGVVTLIGEANEGPGYTEELDLNSNLFGPDDIASVITKYGSGRIVDAFRAIVAAANDPAIVGSVSGVKIVKVNNSAKAEAVLSRSGLGSYAKITARRSGTPGNLIKFKNEVAIAELAPTTGKFAYMPHYGVSAVSFDLRQNGSAVDSNSISSLVDGPNFAATIENVSLGTLASGGILKKPLTGAAGNISLAVADLASNLVTITMPGSIAAANLPSVGDTLVIPKTGDCGSLADSAIIGSGEENRGSYLITDVVNGTTSAVLTAKRLNAPSGAPSVSAVLSTAISSDEDVLCFTQVEIKNISGMDRQSTVGLSSVTFSTNSNSNGSFSMSLNANFAAQPKAGDFVKFASPFAGVAAGLYQVTVSTASSMSCSRLSNGPSGSTGSQLVAGPITQGSQPFTVLKPAIDGLGKSMEIVSEPSLICKNPSTGAAASFATGSPLLVSAAEYRVSANISRGNVSDTFQAGGNVVASFGSTEALADVVVGSSDIKFRVNGAVVFSCAYSQFPTLKDVVDYVNSQTNFTASVSLPNYNLSASSSLDRGTFSLSASSASAKPARLKKDATEYAANTSAGSLSVTELESGSQSGLPEAMDLAQFLTGGAKGGSTGAEWVSAIDACQAVSTNFLVPLISKDASADILAGETETNSTYSVDAVNAYLKSHVIEMSSLKSRKNRTAIVSKSGSYNEQKQAAASLANFRVAMAFQNVKALTSNGTIAEYQPWMGAVIAAGMQAAAGYRGIVKKFANISGIVKPEKDFNPSIPSQLEDALTAGLLILESVQTGGFRFVSDQTTYSVDNNFVYNSLQAVYIADLMALTLIQNFDRAIVGKSVAEISAQIALVFLESEMFNFLRLNFIAPSDDAPKGYKNAKVKLVGGVMSIYLEAKLAGLIYFVPIQFEISQVEQTASTAQ
jgi:hypothetical protein